MSMSHSESQLESQLKYITKSLIFKSLSKSLEMLKTQLESRNAEVSELESWL